MILELYNFNFAFPQSFMVNYFLTCFDFLKCFAFEWTKLVVKLNDSFCCHSASDIIFILTVL